MSDPIAQMSFRELMERVESGITKAEKILADYKELLAVPTPNLDEYCLRYPELKVNATVSLSVSRSSAHYLRVVK